MKEKLKGSNQNICGQVQNTHTHSDKHTLHNSFSHKKVSKYMEYLTINVGKWVAFDEKNYYTLLRFIRVLNKLKHK